MNKNELTAPREWGDCEREANDDLGVKKLL